MSIRNIHKLMALLIIAAFAIAYPLTAQAVGTLSNTTVANRATVNYQVGGVPQTLVESSPTGNSTPGATNGADTTFVVDNRVNLTVATTDAGYVSVVPGATARILTFTVTNTGNTVQDFALGWSHSTDPFNGDAADDFDATNVNVFVESGATVGYQAAEDTATFVDELAADGTRTVYIVADIPGGQVNLDTSALALTATARAGGGGGLGAALTETAGGDTAGVDIVFGDAAGDVDAARDAAHSDRSAYQVSAAALTVTKTSAVYSDPVNGTGATRKAIPGAVITYTVTVANAAGGSQATNVAITDNLSAEISAGRIAFATEFDDGAPNCNPGEGISVNGVCNSNAADADNGSFAADTVTVSGLTINAGASATIKYQVIIAP